MRRLIQRVQGYFQKKPALEIMTDDAFFWENDSEPLKKFAGESMKQLKERYSQIIFYRLSRTWLTRDINIQDWSGMFGAVQLYEVYFLPNGVDLRDLKKTCMDLENREGQRIGDIDIYWPGRRKISRKDKVLE